MATRIQVRRDTAANWAAAPTTLLSSGEIGFESDTLQFKIGDGAAQWQSLEYAGGTTPIRLNSSGTGITDLTDASLRNNGNAKYLILGADTVTVGNPDGLTTATDGQLLVTVAKYDYTGQTSSGAERFLMTLQTLTTGKFFFRTYNGSWSSWYPVITGDSSGNATVPGDLAVNGGDITTTSTGTATVFNTNATTLNVGQAATTVSIGATTGTATIRNATTAISGAATVGSTLGVTGNTTLTGDLAVSGNTTVGGTLGVTGVISGPGTIPVGGIIMWSGTTVPSGWSLCDGGSGTPDLRNKFVICGNLSSGTGNITQTTITSANTQTGGSKDAIVVSHTHGLNVSSGYDKLVRHSTGGSNNTAGSVDNSPGEMDVLSGAIFTIASTGSSGTNANLPPYYALAFIMRTT